MRECIYKENWLFLFDKTHEFPHNKKTQEKKAKNIEKKNLLNLHENCTSESVLESEQEKKEKKLFFLSS